MKVDLTPKEVSGEKAEALRGGRGGGVGKGETGSREGWMSKRRREQEGFRPISQLQAKFYQCLTNEPLACIYLILFIVVETGSLFIAQDGLKYTM